LYDNEEVYETRTVYERDTGLPRRQRTTLNGLKHAPPDGSPSEIAYDDKGRPLELTWHAFGEEHRADGPATIVLYPDTGRPMTEVYKVNGEPRPREQGPFRVRIDRDGKVWEEEFADQHRSVTSQTKHRLEP